MRKKERWGRKAMEAFCREMNPDRALPPIPPKRVKRTRRKKKRG